MELVSWVLGFGDKARVVEPDGLRSTVDAELIQAIRHGRGDNVSA
jgi:hypothetical protein